MKLQFLFSKIIKKLRGVAIKDSIIDKTSKVESGSLIVNSTIGKYSFCGYDCDVFNTEIGNFCSIANNVIIGGAAHPIDWISTSPVFYEGRDSVKKKFQTFQREKDLRTFIKNDVWIGHSVMIKQGVSIGNGAVIGMGSIVTKDVPDYEIWAGNPAKFIRKRFDDDTIKTLLGLKWWNKSDDEIQELSVNFNSIEKSIKR
jgi:acetyltransferase-like isoleucine patch superfamily enzyme